MGRKSNPVPADEVPPEAQAEPSPNGQPEPQPDPEPERNGHHDGYVDRPPPVATFRYGRVKATVWCNMTDRGSFYAVNLVRIYRQEGTNEWAQSNSLGRDDLLPAAEAARDAWKWIHAQMQGETTPF